MSTQPIPELTLKGAHRVAAVISGANIAAVIVMGLVAEILRPSILQAPESIGIVRTAFYVAGFSTILLLKIIGSALLAKQPTDTPQLILIRLVRASAVMSALAEVSGVLGFVLSVLGGARIDTLILMLMSIGLLWINFPRQEKWREYLGPRHYAAVESGAPRRAEPAPVGDEK